MKYYVYSGYASPDNYDASEGPIYTMTVCETVQEVLDLKKYFDRDVKLSESSNSYFRVFHGEEKFLRPKEKVVEYEII